MSGSASDQSLLRARSAHSSHSHLHHRPRHQHTSHGDHHPQPDADPLEHDLDGSHGTGHGDGHGQQLRHREAQAQDLPQINPDNFVTQVIQTVSLIQYVDPAGSPYETQTFYAAPNTVVIDTVSGNTVTISPPDPASVTAAADPASSLVVPGAEPSAPPVAPPFPDDPTTSESVPPAPQPPPTDPAAVPPVPSLPPAESLIPSQSLPIPSAESTTQSLDVTSSLLPPSSALPTTSTYPILIGSLNSTSAAHSSTLSISIPNNSTLSALAETGSSSSSATSSAETSTSRTSSKSSRTTTLSKSVFITSSGFPSSTGVATETGGLGGGVGGDAGGLPGGSEPTDTASADSGPPSSGGLSPRDKQVIGGVVGSVAGFAMLAMLLLLLLRHRRKKDGQPLFGSGLASTSRAITGGDGDGPSGPSMRERSGPFAVASALASLNKKAPPQPAATEERGFYRVSGKKLPSVLHAGGDGYTDPRESVASGNSDYFRGSQEFDPNAVSGGRLALGTPMRPVSGVPIIRSGPARMAVAVPEENPFADPPPPPDPVGRSLVSQDGSRVSRGSGSRFTERI